VSILRLTGFPFLTSVAVQKLEKTIPGTPANELPVHERKRQTYAHHKTLT
jgi:hypothetical protein